MAIKSVATKASKKTYQPTAVNTGTSWEYAAAKVSPAATARRSDSKYGATSSGSKMSSLADEVKNQPSSSMAANATTKPISKQVSTKNTSNKTRKIASY